MPGDFDTAGMQREAEDNISAFTADERKTAAYNAFAKQYGLGPAGDPVAALKLQEYGQSQLTNPIAVQQAQSTLDQTNIRNTGLTEDNSYNALAHPLALQKAALDNTGQSLTNDNTAQSTKFAAQDQPLVLKGRQASINASNASAGAENANAAATRQSTAMTASGTESNAALGMANQLLQVRNSGGDVNAAFEQMAPRIEAMPGVNKDHIEGLRANIGNPGFLENLAGQLGNTTVAQKGMVKLPNSDGSGYSFVPTASVPKAAPGVQSYFDVKTRQVGQRTVQQSQSPQATAIAKTDLGQIDLQYDRTSKFLDDALAKVSTASTGIGGETLGKLPGSAARSLQASVDSAKSNIALLTANMMRQGSKTGSSPVAVRNLQEFKAYQDALGRIDTTASPATVRAQIQEAQSNLQALQAGVHAKYTAQYGADVEGKAAAPAAGGNANGWGNFRVGG
jgi:hypothetical protein